MEKKKAYVKPVLESEMFVPDAYVAACGDENKVYLFTCDGGGGADGGVWHEDNGLPGLQTSGSGDWIGGIFGGHWEYPADTRITYSIRSYHACGETHRASAMDDFITDCYFKTPRQSDSQAISVTVWRGPYGNNVHCTTQLDMNSWTTEKS